MKLTIVIPIYISDPLHLDFTQQTLQTIKTKHVYQTLLVVNYCAPQFETELKQLAVSCRAYKANARSRTPLGSRARETVRSNDIKLIYNPSGNILASAWNLGIKQSFKIENDAGIPAIGARSRTPLGSRARQLRMPNRHTTSDYCLILNNDILLHPQAVDNLVMFAEDHPEFLLWSGTEWSDARTLSQAKWDNSFSLHPHFSCFMLNQKTIDTVGLFDENLQLGYFEDNDYHIRILLSGHQAAAATACKFYHYGSRTINVDDHLRVEAKYHYQLNREYLKKKWGLDLHGRGFSPPDTILKEVFKHPFNNPHKSIKIW